MSNAIIFTLGIPLLTALILLLNRTNRSFQQTISITAAVLMIILNLLILEVVLSMGPMALNIGGHDAPYAVTFVVDIFSSIMLLLGSVLSLVGLLFSYQMISSEREKHGYYAIWHFLIVGINGSFITADIFNLFVFYEILLMASYVLLVIGSSKKQLRATFLYMTVNVIATVFLLIGIGLLYSTTGTLNFADIAILSERIEDGRMMSLISMIFLVVFSIKGALFPMFIWLPDVYASAKSPVTFIFTALVTKVGIYSLIRFFTLIFDPSESLVQVYINFIAIMGMVIGVLGAVSYSKQKKILAYHSISQIGYMAVAFSLYTIESVAASILFLLHHSVVKGGLFISAGIAQRIRGTDDIYADSKMRCEEEPLSLHKSYPMLSWGFFALSISLFGAPPFSGFFAKMLVIESALGVGSYVTVIFAVLVGILTLYSMSKILLAAYWSKKENRRVTAVPIQGKTLSIISSSEDDKPMALEGLSDSDLEIIQKIAHEKNNIDIHDEHDMNIIEGIKSKKILRSTDEINFEYTGAIIPLYILVFTSMCMGIFAEPLINLCTSAAEQLLDRMEYIQAVFPHYS